jgi:hypothetical protein
MLTNWMDLTVPEGSFHYAVPGQAVHDPLSGVVAGDLFCRVERGFRGVGMGTDDQKDGYQSG